MIGWNPCAAVFCPGSEEPGSFDDDGDATASPDGTAREKDGLPPTAGGL
jgi:hypothetical protein